jgi:uncharacterized membrane protein YGL010W
MKISVSALLLSVGVYMFYGVMVFPVFLLALVSICIFYPLQELKNGLTMNTILVELSFLAWTGFVLAVYLDNDICSALKIIALTITTVTWFYQAYKKQTEVVQPSRRKKILYGISSGLIIIAAIFKILHLQGAPTILLIGILFFVLLELVVLWFPHKWI